MKKNLIFFLARFGKGGAGNSVFKLCKSLNKRKYNIFVVAFNHPEFSGCRISPHVYTTIEEIDRFSEAMESIIKNGVKS